tara:strand:- start:9974 stop:10879 length:906 start_codon:yes stop_codon:yes gene_type:complete
MDKLLEALKSLLPEDQIKEVSETVEGYLTEAKTELEKEYDDKLKEAYVEMTEEKTSDEAVAEQGYQQAYAIIQDLRNRLELQKEEFEAALEEGYEEAYKHIKEEQGKNNNIEVEMYEEYEKKLNEMRDYVVDKVDQFLQFKGKEIYEQARRDVVSDPRMVEHKVTLDRIVELASNYISDDEYAAATSSRLDEAEKNADDLKGQMRILEARNIRLGSQNTKLQEAVRDADALLTEQAGEITDDEKKERAAKATQASGRGKKVADSELIAEYGEGETDAEEDVLTEQDEYHDLKVLSGLVENQ